MRKTIIIDDETNNDIIFPKGLGRGLVPRDYAVDPLEMFAPPSQMNLIPRSEWDARIDEQERLESSMEHIRLTGNNGSIIPSLQQGNIGYCWAHSTVQTVILSRAASNQPYVPLSAYAVAAIIKRGANQGGWCGQSAKFCREVGVPSQVVWPQGSRDLKLDTPAMRANASRHKITEDWVDLTRDLYDQQLTFDQVASCLLTNVPVAADFNFWGHSVCLIRLVKLESGSYGVKLLNSWGDSWGDRGMGILSGRKAIPDGAIATRVTVASSS